MIEVFTRAHEHKGAAFVEVYQNCNVFNDGAFDTILNKDARPDMLINLKHGEPVRFGAENEFGVVLNEYGEAMIVRVDDVGVERLVVHDEHRPDPSLAFALFAPGRPARDADADGRVPLGRTPRVRGGDAAPTGRRGRASGPGDLSALLRSAPTWTVN